MKKNKWKKYQKSVKNKCREMSSNGIENRCKFYRGFGIVEWNGGLLIDSYDSQDDKRTLVVQQLIKAIGAEKIFAFYSAYIKETGVFNWRTVETLIDELMKEDDEHDKGL